MDNIRFNSFILIGLIFIGLLADSFAFAAALQDPSESTQTINPADPIPPDPTQQTQQSKKSTNKKDKVDVPAPENLTLDTSDGVQLKCTYFKAAALEGADQDAGKVTIPFILLHDWEGTRADMLPFAQYLQSLGCAVIVPDLRGHGESTAVAKSTTPLDYEKFRKSEVLTTLKDIETCKKYLVQRNNDGELNIDMLNLVAVGETAVLAVRWTLADWYAFPPVQGGIKQGQDVKSLTMISPRRKLAGISLNTEVKHSLFAGSIGPNLPTMIVWAADDESGAKDGSWIYETMRKGRPDVDKIEDAAEKAKATTLFQAPVPSSSANGGELMRDGRSARVMFPFLARFVASQVGTRRDEYPWTSREKK